MSWREIIVQSASKLSCSGNYLIVRNESILKIHLSEIALIIIATPQVSITGVAMCEIVKYKIKIIFCDEKHNPYGEMVGYYGCHNCSKKVQKQIAWNKDLAQSINTAIIYQKINNQGKMLLKYGFQERAESLFTYANEIETNDITNREGHAAKVYFNTLFGMEFTRDMASNINSALNYGYSILLSCINREVVSNGCLTTIGINHRNEYNHFNFSCDIIEPFRVIIDEYVYLNKDVNFDKNYKFAVVDLLNKEVILDNKCTLINAIKISVKSIIDALNGEPTEVLKLFEFS